MLRTLFIRIQARLRTIKVKVVRTLSRIRAFFMRIFRNIFRNNDYQNPKRLLVYIIYESENQLQEYKIRFLEGLLPLVDNVRIIVNGDLPQEDISYLKKLGDVSQRENSGYDAGAFRFGVLSFSQEELKAYDQLLLVNDTNIGPLSDLATIFEQMDSTKLDFWGMSFGESQPDFTNMNPYGYIPDHLQSYFLVIENSLLRNKAFYDYWKNLPDTSSRDAAIGRHETVFTHYFANRGYVYDAVLKEAQDSPIYIHPMRAIHGGMPLVKYSALANFNDEQFRWQDLERVSEVPELLTYIKTQTDYPVSILEEIVTKFKNKAKVRKEILIIDGVENIIPQCTRYRVINKAEQLKHQGFKVNVVNASSFVLMDAKNACAVIVYRATPSEKLDKLVHLMKHLGRKVYYDIDDLVFDTKYTDQLIYTQSLSKKEKRAYDQGVEQYGCMLKKCDAVITSTSHLCAELENYSSEVILNRNVLSRELVAVSAKALEHKTDHDNVRVAYFSGSITHNENFELIKSAVIKLLERYEEVELHLVGHLDIPQEFQKFSERIVFHPYVEWEKLPSLIAQVDINLAPLKSSQFNEAKSEIKWLEASAVKVPTVASRLGAFEEMISDGETGVLADDNQWYEKLEELIVNKDRRNSIAEKAHWYVMNNCTTETTTLAIGCK